MCNGSLNVELFRKYNKNDFSTLSLKMVIISPCLGKHWISFKYNRTRFLDVCKEKIYMEYL